MFRSILLVCHVLLQKLFDLGVYRDVVGGARLFTVDLGSGDAEQCFVNCQFVLKVAGFGGGDFEGVKFLFVLLRLEPISFAELETAESCVRGGWSSG
jgi:hypothetical protein